MFNGRNMRCRKCFREREVKKYEKEKSEISIDRTISKKLVVARRHAKERRREFSLTKEYVISLWEIQCKKCFYSGIEMKTQISSSGELNKSVSIDRIDSSKGYIEGNIVLCCSFVNIMKHILPQNTFINICKAIAKHHK